jgi:hypothetical protein
MGRFIRHDSRLPLAEKPGGEEINGLKIK